MALDPLEKERLRRKMADRMSMFQDGTPMVVCVSAHYVDTPPTCELCQTAHGNEVMVIKNRSGKKKMSAALSCLKEMVRFKVTDVEDLERWLPKLSELRAEHEKRKVALEAQRAEERKRLEKKIIVRKRTSSSDVS